MELSVDRLQTYAIAFVVIGIVLALGLRVMTGVQEGARSNLNVDNETFNATSDPFTYTVAEASDSEFVQLTRVTCYESDAQNTELADEDCNISDASAGKVSVSTALDDGDESVAYEYEDTNKATEGADQAILGLSTFTDWLPLIALVIVAAIIIGLVSMFKGGSKRRGA